MVRNERELTSLTLACLLGRDTIFQVKIRQAKLIGEDAI